MISSNTFKTFHKKNKTTNAKFTFFPAEKLPENIPISTPLHFVYIGSELVLCLDKDKQWNTVCGKIEDSETWRQAVVRETYEEVGLIIEENYNL